ncbi:MAG TPA: class I SAM-dependent methyltransferase [Saprospiraceae bacterium]|nr:class I SAM-dependent methyltransferase [Saprospiraceae bacterium]
MAVSRWLTLLKTALKGGQVFPLEYSVRLMPRYGHGLPAHPLLLKIINQNRSAYQARLQEALRFQKELIQIPDQKSNPDSKSPGWNNGFLPGLDMVMLYSILATTKPALYLEIGSGNSTKVAYKSKTDQHLSTKIISIDPAPRAEIDRLVDQVIRTPFEETDKSVFTSLASGDIVFVDNSHRVLPNSDAMVFFMEVLPMLPPGVIVQIHDVYLPYDYPQFMAERYYSEQYMLAAFLMANPDRYEVMMPNYFVSEDPELRQILEPLWTASSMPPVERHGGSFWFKIAG